MTISKAFLQTLFLFLFVTLIGGSISFLSFFLKYPEYTAPIALTISFLISYWLFYKLILKETPKLEETEFPKIKDSHIFSMIIIVIGLKFFEQPIFDLLQQLVIPEEFKEFLQNRKFQNKELTISFALYAVPALVIAPIAEELFFRNYLLKNLLQKNSVATSIIISSICFSLVHLPNYINLIPTFLLGLILGYVMTKTKNISVCIAIHFLFNLTVTLLTLYGKHLYENLESLNYNPTYWLLCLSGSILVFFGLRTIAETEVQ